MVMAVRNFDLSESSGHHLSVVEPAPLSRVEVRRSRTRAAAVAVVALVVPFAAALILLGVAN